ncbi:MAG TPA: TIGR02391 family protein, partial [Candidatus Acidoferrum sp.]|nr:TIGR02391 family protein [Candidatus Acidoferrum sp.]
FPRKALHPAIASSTFALFIRGHYDTVVFEAFRAVEVAVRQATGLPQDLVGSNLMRRAFDVSNGPLTDPSLVQSEKQAMSDLFAGAMGMFKNPTSHRVAAISKPEDAVDLVMFANYLLRLVDQRSAAPKLIP